MNYADFRQQYEQEFTPSERDLKLYELADRYVTLTENYDRTVCTGPMHHGSIMPANSHELGLINQHAGIILARMPREMVEFGISHEEILRAASRL